MQTERAINGDVRLYDSRRKIPQDGDITRPAIREYTAMNRIAKLIQ